MRLREARARFGLSFALGLGVSAVLALATIISRRFIETPGSLSRPPVLRAAAVFAPTLRGEVAGPRELDAVAGPRAGDGAEDQDATTSAAAAILEGKLDPGQGPAGVPAHRPQPIPEDLLLSLAYRAPLAANLGQAAARARPSRPAPAARPPEEPPPLELIEEDLWPH